MTFNHFCLLALLLLPGSMFSQSESTTWSGVAAVGGYSRFWSLDLERTVWKGDAAALSLRMGAGYQAQAVYVPGRLQFYTTRSVHRLQASLGATVLYDRSKVQNPDTFLLLGAGLGYRFSPAELPFWLQVGYVQLLSTDPTATQLIDPDPVWVPALELSVGIPFP